MNNTTLAQQTTATPATTGASSLLATAATVGWGIVHAGSIGASAYHGYRRNDSLGWGIVWGLAGGVFPILTPAFALAQGFGKRKKGARRRRKLR
jgi:hypothetical protein